MTKIKDTKKNLKVEESTLKLGNLSRMNKTQLLSTAKNVYSEYITVSDNLKTKIEDLEMEKIKVKKLNTEIRKKEEIISKQKSEIGKLEKAPIKMKTTIDKEVAKVKNLKVEVKNLVTLIEKKDGIIEKQKSNLTGLKKDCTKMRVDASNAFDKKSRENLKIKNNLNECEKDVRVKKKEISNQKMEIKKLISDKYDAHKNNIEEIENIKKHHKKLLTRAYICILIAILIILFVYLF